MKLKIFSLLAMIVLVGCINIPEGTDEPLVGGDKDDHGCIASAGYNWCEEKGKCVI